MGSWAENGRPADNSELPLPQYVPEPMRFLSDEELEMLVLSSITAQHSRRAQIALTHRLPEGEARLVPPSTVPLVKRTVLE